MWCAALRLTFLAGWLPCCCRENVINDGTTTASMAPGTLADFALALRNKRIDDDIMVATADSLFYPDTVNVWGILQVRRLAHARSGCLSASPQPAEGRLRAASLSAAFSHIWLAVWLLLRSTLSRRRPILSRAITRSQPRI